MCAKEGTGASLEGLGIVKGATEAYVVRGFGCRRDADGDVGDIWETGRGTGQAGPVSRAVCAAATTAMAVEEVGVVGGPLSWLAWCRQGADGASSLPGTGGAADPTRWSQPQRWGVPSWTS